MSYEYLVTVEIAKRKSDDPARAADRLCSSAMRNGALATDILDTPTHVYCNILWPSEGSWNSFRKDNKLRKTRRRNVWTKRIF
jgi:hypothetical protein